MSEKKPSIKIKDEDGYLLKTIKANPEILKNDPSLMKRRNESEFMIKAIKANSIAFKYIGSLLKEDLYFLNKVLEQNPVISIKEIVDNCPNITISENGELCNGEGKKDYTSDKNYILALLKTTNICYDKKLMSLAIDADINSFDKASKEIKDDFDFLNKKSFDNYEVIRYVSNNFNKFGTNGIKGVRQASKTITNKSYIEEIKKLNEAAKDTRCPQILKWISTRDESDPLIIRGVTALVANAEEVSLELIEKVFDYSKLSMVEARNTLDKNGKIIISYDTMQGLITPQILMKIKDKLPDGDKRKENIEKSLKEYIKFYEPYKKEYNSRKPQIVLSRNKDYSMER